MLTSNYWSNAEISPTPVIFLLVHGNSILPAASVGTLGVTLDSSLSHTPHLFHLQILLALPSKYAVVCPPPLPASTTVTQARHLHPGPVQWPPVWTVPRPLTLLQSVLHSLPGLSYLKSKSDLDILPSKILPASLKMEASVLTLAHRTPSDLALAYPYHLICHGPPLTHSASAPPRAISGIWLVPSHLEDFALAVPWAWIALFPDIGMAHSLTLLRSLSNVTPFVARPFLTPLSEMAPFIALYSLILI